MNDFAAALRDLNGCGLRHVVVGGLAVIRHGVVHCFVDLLDVERLRDAHGELPEDGPRP